VCIDGQTGRLVAPGDRTALRAAVEALRGDASQRTALGQAGRALCRERFAASTMVAHLERVYASILARTRRSA